jgi:hypothetical protein
MDLGDGGERPPKRMAIMNLPEDQPLSDALRKWKVSEPVSPRLREGVWRRIAHTEAQSERTLAVWWRAWLAGVFAKPALAAGYVTVLLAAGLTAGYLQGEARQQRTNDELAARYVRSLDPYQHLSP